MVIPRRSRDGIHCWWEDQPGERYWLDVTDRENREWLASPRGGSRSSSPRTQRLITHVRGGDVVFHYDSVRGGIVAASVCQGGLQKREFAWPRPDSIEGGSEEVRMLPSWGIALRPLGRLDPVVSLAEIARTQWSLYPALRALEDRVGDPLHYPFEMGNREATRPLAGYVWKLPAILVNELPALANAALASPALVEGVPVPTHGWTSWHQPGSIPVPSLGRLTPQR
jgi:hypothetical protein